MNSTKELAAAVERKLKGYDGVPVHLRFEQSSHDKAVIANAFTNPAPLSAKALGEWFKKGEPLTLPNGAKVDWSHGSGNELLFEFQPADEACWYNLLPAPETIGDFMFLLWRLSRTTKGND